MGSVVELVERDAEIRRLRSDGVPLRVVADRFGLSLQRVSAIARGDDARARKARLYSYECPGCGVPRVGSSPGEVGAHCVACISRLRVVAADLAAADAAVELRRLADVLRRAPSYHEWQALRHGPAGRAAGWQGLLGAAGLPPRPSGSRGSTLPLAAFNVLYGRWPTPPCGQAMRDRRLRVGDLLDRYPWLTRARVAGLVGVTPAVAVGDVAWLATTRLLPEDPYA